MVGKKAERKKEKTEQKEFSSSVKKTAGNFPHKMKALDLSTSVSSAFFKNKKCNS